METAIYTTYGPAQIYLPGESEGLMLNDAALPVGEDSKALNHKLYASTALKLFLLSMLRALIIILFMLLKTAKGLLTSAELLLRSVESGLFTRRCPNFTGQEELP